MTLVREILFLLEKQEDAVFDRRLEGFGDFSQSQIAYHVNLLSDAGLVVGEVKRMGDGSFRIFSLERLTWEGHEFLDAARNDTVWNRSQQLVKKNGGSIPFDILKDVLKTMVRELMFSAPAV